jgi:hypothetical protein
MMIARHNRRQLLLPLLAALCLTMAFLASGCLWGIVTDADTGAGIAGATVSYTDADGHTASTTTNASGLYAFDSATGPVPVAGAATFEVSALGYETLTETRLIRYNDNPHATLDNPSSFWEVQHFDLASEGPSGSVHILEYTPFNPAMESGAPVRVRVAYEVDGPFEFKLTLGYEVKAKAGILWCDESVPVSPGARKVFLECDLGPMPDWAPPEYPYPHEQGIVEVLLQYEAAPGSWELVAGEFVVDDDICPCDDDWPWPVCP